MIETITLFVAKSIISYGLGKGLDNIIKNWKTFEKKLTNIIYKTIDDYKVQHPDSKNGQDIFFFDSQFFLEELLTFKLFEKNGHKLDNNKILSELAHNPNIKPPEQQEINDFLSLFVKNINADDDLKELFIEENYREEIFNISEGQGQIYELLKQIQENQKIQSVNKIPKEITALQRISEDKIVGRKTDLENLRNSLLENKETLLVNGMGGIGKTTLAMVYVQKYYDDYEHLLWLTIENNLETAVVTNKDLLENLNLTNIPPQELLRVCMKALRNIESIKPNLMVIDNAAENLSKFYDLLPKPPGWHILATSREHIEGFKLLELDFLSEDDAIILFNMHNNRFSNEQILSIVGSVEYHTLTIEILAKSSSIRQWSFDKLMNALSNDEKSGIKVPHSHKKIDRIKSYLSSIFNISNLDEKEIWLLKQFIHLPNDWIEYNFLGILLHADNIDWKEDFGFHLNSLYEKGYLQKDLVGNSYKMHPVLIESLSPKLQTNIEAISVLIESVTILLDIDQAKDNPVDKFPFVPLGDAILKKIKHSSEEEISKLQNNLALVYKDLGEYEKARDLLELALDSDLRNYGEKHPSVAIRQSNLALVYTDLGEYEKARDLLQLALDSDLRNYGEKHPNVAIRQSNLASVYTDLGEYEKARDLLELALDSNLKNFGEKHPYVAISQSNLALVYRYLGEYEKARDLLELALESDLRNYGEKHPSVAQSQSNLALVYRDLGEFEKARDLLELALDSNLKNYGEKHPYVAIIQTNLGLVYQDLGEYEKARDLLKTAIESDIKNYGENHTNVARRQSNLATVYQNLGEYEKAMDLLELAYKIFYEKFGENHPSTKTVNGNLEYNKKLMSQKK